jgi:hypothetical protein
VSNVFVGVSDSAKRVKRQSISKKEKMTQRIMQLEENRSYLESFYYGSCGGNSEVSFIPVFLF